MALLFAKAVMFILGLIYALLGVTMAGNGILCEINRRMIIPMRVILNDPPPVMFEEEAEVELNHIPYIVVGIMLTIVGICFVIGAF